SRRLEFDWPDSPADVRRRPGRDLALACRRSRRVPCAFSGGVCAMDVTIRRAGMLTTVQDLGRTGFRASGVPLSGAMDRFAHRVANLLVGNAESAAALEFTLLG